MNYKLSIPRAETRGYNDCKKGVSTCPYQDEVLVHYWLIGFNAAWDELQPKTEQVQETEVNVYPEDTYLDSPPDGYFSNYEASCEMYYYSPYQY